MALTGWVCGGCKLGRMGFGWLWWGFRSWLVVVRRWLRRGGFAVASASWVRWVSGRGLWLWLCSLWLWVGFLGIFFGGGMLVGWCGMLVGWWQRLLRLWLREGWGSNFQLVVQEGGGRDFGVDFFFLPILLYICEGGLLFVLKVGYMNPNYPFYYTFLSYLIKNILKKYYIFTKIHSHMGYSLVSPSLQFLIGRTKENARSISYLYQCEIIVKILQV